MTDRLETMSIFVRVVDEGSLTSGARALRMPIATVSRRISELEGKLGAELLLRSPRGLTLTDTGRTYVAACRRILEDVSEAERNASGEFTAPRGTLTMTAPIVFGRLHVLPAVNAFLRTFQDVDVRLELTDRPVNLHEEHLDLAVRIGPLADSMFIARKVGAVRRIVCASPSYLEKRETPKLPGDLANLDGITFQSLMSPQDWRFGSGRQEFTVPVRSRLIVNSAEAAIDAAIDGLGFTRVLSYQAAAAIRAGQLVPLLQDFEPEPWPVHLLYEPRALIPKKLRAFLDFAAPRIAADIA
ncbi:LysR family transcriptional regulator [Aquicoccus sp. SU-CL01552]|uniref:LysR family transcriptional regulator n=1 Tax=Aquicoccus sp. SU-CL01552 TaxID=3127656 RepID=UPI0031044B09